MANLWKGFKSLQLFSKQLTQGLNSINVPNGCRSKTFAAPRKRIPDWLPKPERQPYKESLTPRNQAFIQDYIKTLQEESPLKDVQPIQTVAKASSRRTGLIAKKIGVYPMWLKNGDRVQSTLLQVFDNEVVKYIPPEEFNPMVPPKRKNKRYGYLIVGAENIDPQLLTKKYYGIFAKAGVTPKKYLARFVVSPDAALQTGTRLDVNHFQPGDVLDIRAKTIGRGFQGVMKRWGFKGQPASHGQTKTHRRPGNIGSGSSRARVVPGTKMPGHMGHRWRVHRGIRILRINPQYNVIWVLGQNIPGEVNSYCYLYDTILPRRKTMKTRFPTYLPETDENPVNDFYADDVHNFEDPTITFKPES